MQNKTMLRLMVMKINISIRHLVDSSFVRTQFNDFAMYINSTMDSYT